VTTPGFANPDSGVPEIRVRPVYAVPNGLTVEYLPRLTAARWILLPGRRIQR
jgi:hypothetical protein